MAGIGLVLAGGGGKGAYQIGVWRYLKEYGLDKYVCAVSGTSVGALNAALFASGDYDAAEKIWKNITPNQILSSGWCGHNFVDWKIDPTMFRVQSNMVDVWKMYSQLEAERVINRFLSQSCFTRDGLLKIMRNQVDMQRVQCSKIPCYATCLEISQFTPVRFELRHFARRDIETILLASSAIPFIFDVVQFKGKYYLDGGLPVYGDNVPIEPLYKRGIRFFVVVHLSQNPQINREQFPGACIVEIVPQEDLGDLVTGTLDFSSAGAKQRMKQGYRDTERVFRDYFRAGKSFSRGGGFQ